MVYAFRRLPVDRCFAIWVQVRAAAPTRSGRSRVDAVHHWRGDRWLSPPCPASERPVSGVRGKIEMYRRRAEISCDPAKGQIALQYSKTSSLRIDTPYPHERCMGLCSTALGGIQYRISANLEDNLPQM